MKEHIQMKARETMFPTTKNYEYYMYLPGLLASPAPSSRKAQVLYSIRTSVIII